MNYVKILNKSGIIVLPTDTIFGIVARAEDKNAVEKVYKIKGRSPQKPCIILVTKISDLKKFGISHYTLLKYNKILENLWYKNIQPVSIIFPIKKKFLKKFYYLHRGSNSLAFRMVGKRNKNLFSILEKTGPLIAPSANPEGLSPAKNISEAKKYFGDNVDVYIAGKNKKTKPSTLISLTGSKPTVLREGSVKIKI